MTGTPSFGLLELLEMAGMAMVGNLPMLLAYAVALIFIIVRWRRAPRASLLALCGVLLGLFLQVLMPLLYVWASRRAMNAENPALEMQSLYTILALAGSIAHAVSFGFLFLAIYADRRYPSPPPGY